MAALHLRLPDLSAEGARRIAKVDNFLAKYDPDEPRDWRGRWTTAGGGSGGPASTPTPAPKPSSTKPDNHWDGVSHPTGGHLILTGGGEDEAEDNYGRNEPIIESRPEWEPVPSLRAPRAPTGWDEYDDGAIVRRPRLPDGRLWPEATTGVVLRIGAQEGPGKPSMWLFVPRDGKGPTLVGSDAKEDFLDPPGYDKVQLIGIPQETRKDGTPTNHALDSVQAALRYAATNRYSRLYFNSSITTSTGGEIESNLRPDLMGVARPQLNLGYRFQPYESYSPRQKPAERELQLQLHPDIAKPEGNIYKFLRWMWAQFQRRFRSPRGRLRSR